ncbi:MAG: PIN domain-containing protein, partial [Betaproteobacteria bacterium]|nr:PIN domain-containing protein [Betaproteobacteria bacterium]
MGLPDPDDRDILAAAIAGYADSNVNFSLKGFAADALELQQVDAIHPDDWRLNP